MSDRGATPEREHGSENAELRAEVERLRQIERRLVDVADALGVQDPNDQRELCVRARALGASYEVLSRENAALRARIARLEAPQ